jgi:hypothetical protein
MDPVHFIEEAAAAGFGAVGLLLAAATPKPLEHELLRRKAYDRLTGCHRVGPAVKYSPNYGETTRGV